MLDRRVGLSQPRLMKNKTQKQTRHARRPVAVLSEAAASPSPRVIADWLQVRFGAASVAAPSSSSLSCLASALLPLPEEEEEERAQRRGKRQRRASSDEEYVDDEEEEEQVYCVCRRQHRAGMAYIACDSCNEWYHPECMNTTLEVCGVVGCGC